MYIWINNPLSITRIEGGSFHVDWLSTFTHGIYLSVKFLESRGVTNIQFLPNTLKYIEKNMQDNALSDSVQKELEYIVQMLPNEEA